MVSNDVIREYATDHGVFAPVGVDVTIDVLPDDECPSLEAGRPPNPTRIFHIKHTWLSITAVFISTPRSTCRTESQVRVVTGRYPPPVGREQ